MGGWEELAVFFCWRQSPYGQNDPEGPTLRSSVVFNDWMKTWITPGRIPFPHAADLPAPMPRVGSADLPAPMPRVGSARTLQTAGRVCSEAESPQKPHPGQYPNRGNWKLNKYGAYHLPTRSTGGIDTRTPELPYM
eukprot:GEMP01062932.1.p1 GENE.GEMP01062932.1~~GEMP01062932.1.p1  ORF type:complete len:136 (+),score=24.54 GEMP01062932.1:598-1005(+)